MGFSTLDWWIKPLGLRGPALQTGVMRLAVMRLKPSRSDIAIDAFIAFICYANQPNAERRSVGMRIQTNALDAITAPEEIGRHVE